MVDVRYMADELEFVKSIEKENMNKLIRNLICRGTVISLISALMGEIILQ